MRINTWCERLMMLMLVLSGLTASADTTMRVFTKFSAADGLADNSAHTIHCTKTGRLVITTMGQINFYDGQKFTYIDPVDENLYPLSDYQGNYHLYFDRYHHLWLKNTHNVTCVNLTTERFVPSIEEVFGQFGIHKKVKDLFVDQQGVLFLLTEDGLYNVDNQRSYAVRPGLNLQDLNTYKDEYLYLFYENGIAEKLLLSTGETVGQGAPYGKADERRYNKSSVIMPEDSLFYQIRNGEKESVLCEYNLDTDQWQEILRVPYHLNNLAKLDSQIYIACEYGYWIYDVSTRQTIHVPGMKMEYGHVVETCVNTLEFDRQGGMWLGTERSGLMYSRPYVPPFTQYGWEDPRALEYARLIDGKVQPTKFKGKDVNCVYRDSRGWTWVGTYHGLQFYRSGSDHLPQMVTKSDGLLNNVIHSIIEDQQHNIWVATSYGISCIMLDGEKVHFINSYNHYDHVPNESFVNGRVTSLPDGTIVMQALDHVVTFNPSKMQTLKDNFPFKIYPKLIRLMVNGVEIRTGEELDGNVILERALSRTKEINLNYNQNSLSLVFSALNFFRPYQTFYRVRIKGLIDDWQTFATYNSGGLVDTRGLLHLPMMSLRPGSYVVEVQSSMLPDQWNSDPYEWIINVHEPWWRTTGMFVLYGVIFLILLAINAYYYLRNTNMKAKRNSEEVTLLKRILSFVERCGERREILEPLPEQITSDLTDQQNELSPEFIAAMIKIIPAVQGDKKPKLTMRALSEMAGLEVQRFYSIVTANIYKSPRALVRTMMLRQAEELLRNSDRTIDEIAKVCGFVSPNFFIATFYHFYQKTPSEFREQQ